MPKKAPEWLNDDIKEFYDPNDVNIRAIQRSILAKRGEPLIPYMTITTRMNQLGLERPRDKSKKAPRETPMSVDDTQTDVAEVLPGQITFDEDIPPLAEVYTEAVGEFDALPAGYAKVIQPIREYTEAEDDALKESVRLFGFIGAIVRDQYGRILDGNQRSRVARWFGKGCPYTITHVNDDAHALAVATALNAVRRQYPREQREQIAIAMRDQGFSYRVIAEALGVSKDTVQRDIKAVSHETPDPVTINAPVSHETTEVVMITEMETDFTPDHMSLEPHVSHETPTPVTIEAPVPHGTSDPVARVTGKDKKSYPAQRPTASRTPKTPQRFDLQRAEDQAHRLVMTILQHCDTMNDLTGIRRLMETIKRLVDSRAKLLGQAEPQSQ
jgi:hypothetical protein